MCLTSKLAGQNELPSEIGRSEKQLDGSALAPGKREGDEFCKNDCQVKKAQRSGGATRDRGLPMCEGSVSSHVVAVLTVFGIFSLEKNRRKSSGPASSHGAVLLIVGSAFPGT